MAMLDRFFLKGDRRTYDGCKSMYQGLRSRRPGLADEEYYIYILYQHPPFDYQEEDTLRDLAQRCSSINELASMVCKFCQSDRRSGQHYWKLRDDVMSLGIKKREIEARRDQFLRRWDD